MESFECGACKTKFLHKKNLTRHVKSAGKKCLIKSLELGAVNESIPDTFICANCNKQFTLKHNLRRHIVKQHMKEKPFKRIRMNFKATCSICHERPEDLLSHYVNDHNIQIESETIEFDDEKSFKEWKKMIEKSTNQYFVISKSRQEKKRKYTPRTTKFTCHRSGTYKSRGKNLRRIKIQNSNKIGGCCPAGMYVTVNESQRFLVNYIKTHIGHEGDELAHINLPKEFREFIADKIASGISFERILDDVRDSVIGLDKDAEPDRCHLISRKDLLNIEMLFDLKRCSIRKSDRVSVDTWVEENKDFVLSYKSPHETQNGLLHNEDDFILIIMNNAQKTMLQKYGSDVICLDTTHGLNPYDFQMHTLMVVDDLRQGFPCAFMFSNKSDESTIDIFIDSIKKEVGVVNCRVLMTDMAQEYYNSWRNSMTEPKFKLHCLWHVDTAWRKNLNKVKTSERQAQVYHTIRTMLEETDILSFEKMLQSFMNITDRDLLDFVNYFRWYAERKECWAFCYRQNVGSNPNMHLERMHSLLKNIYLKGNRVQSLDKVVHALMAMIKNKLFDRVIASYKGELASKLSVIRKRHSDSEKRNPLSVIPVKGGWHVPSFQQVSKMTEIYFIQETDAKNCNCKLICASCNTCIHRFSCTCVDNAIRWNFCKHIHLLCRYLSCNNDFTCQYQEMILDNEEVCNIPVNEIIEEPIFSFLKNTEIRSENIFEGFDVLNKEIAILQDSVTTKEEIDVFRQALKAAKIRFSGSKASKSDQL